MIADLDLDGAEPVQEAGALRLAGNTIFLLCMMLVAIAPRAFAGGSQSQVLLNIPGQFGYDITLDPRDDRRGWVITDAGLFGSDDGFQTVKAVSVLRGPSLQRILVDPNRPGRIYVAAGNGGLWMSGDQGITWRRTLDRAVFSLASAPDGTVFATAGVGSGSGRQTPDPWSPWELVSSRDGGEQWKRVYLGFGGGYGTDSGVPKHIVADPKKAGRLWSGGHFGLWRSDDEGRRWEQVPGTDRVHSLVVHPRTGRVFVGGHDGLGYVAVSETCSVPRPPGWPEGLCATGLHDKPEVIELLPWDRGVLALQSAGVNERVYWVDEQGAIHLIAALADGQHIERMVASQRRGVIFATGFVWDASKNPKAVVYRIPLPNQNGRETVMPPGNGHGVWTGPPVSLAPFLIAVLTIITIFTGWLVQRTFAGWVGKRQPRS